MILDVFQWVNRWKNKDFKIWQGKCTFSQKRVPEAMRIKISSFIINYFKHGAKHSPCFLLPYGRNAVWTLQRKNMIFVKYLWLQRISQFYFKKIIIINDEILMRIASGTRFWENVHLLCQILKSLFFHRFNHRNPSKTMFWDSISCSGDVSDHFWWFWGFLKIFIFGPLGGKILMSRFENLYLRVA